MSTNSLLLPNITMTNRMPYLIHFPPPFCQNSTESSFYSVWQWKLETQNRPDGTGCTLYFPREGEHKVLMSGPLRGGPCGGRRGGRSRTVCKGLLLRLRGVKASARVCKSVGGSSCFSFDLNVLPSRVPHARGDDSVSRSLVTSTQTGRGLTLDLRVPCVKTNETSVPPNT